MIFLENGIPIYAAYFAPIEFDITFIAGFVSAVSIYGLQVFPNQDLEDITFSRHHLMLVKHVVFDKPLIFLVIHDPKESHVTMKKIVTELLWALKRNHSDALRRRFIYPAQFKPLDDEIKRIFTNESRDERLLPLSME